MKNPFRKRFRIVRDGYAGYEVQIWRWWFPFWTMAGRIHSFSSISSATEYADRFMKPVVEYLN